MHINGAANAQPIASSSAPEIEESEIAETPSLAPAQGIDARNWMTLKSVTTAPVEKSFSLWDKGIPLLPFSRSKSVEMTIVGINTDTPKFTNLSVTYMTPVWNTTTQRWGMQDIASVAKDKTSGKITVQFNDGKKLIVDPENGPVKFGVWALKNDR